MICPSDSAALRPEAALEALRRALELHPARAVIALIEVAPPLASPLRRGIDGLVQEHGVTPDALSVIEVRDTAGVRAELTTINRERDLRLAAQRLLVVLAADAAALRLARELAPDLLTSPDLRLTVAPPEPAGTASRDALAAHLRALMLDRHRELDLTGLLPGTVERRTVALDSIFMELADFTESALPPLARDGANAPRPRATLILADPGAGKTTLLRRLVTRYAAGEEDPLEIGECVALLLPLAEIADSRVKDRVRPIPEFLGEWLAAQGVDAAGLDALLPRMLLLLDGIDEVPDPQLRLALVEEALGLAEHQRILAVVLTGRSLLVDELRRFTPRCRMLRLRPPTREQIEDYLRHFMALRTGTQPATTPAELTRRIWEDRDLRALAATPLLLLFLALLHEFEGRLPDRRVEIYARLSELLVDRWVHARSLASRSARSRTMTRGEVQTVLGPLAWWIVERGGAAVPEFAFKARLTDLLGRREDPPEAERRAGELLQLLQHESALLRPEPGRRWAFIHHSVAEFFAAREAEREPTSWEFLLADPYATRWREVLLFAAGIVGTERGSVARVDALFAAVDRGARRRGRYEARHPNLLVGLLREDPGLSTRQRRALLQRLGEFWFVNAFFQESALLAQAEAVDFLDWSAGSALAPLVRDLLDHYLTQGALHRVQWDRVFASALVPSDGLPASALPDLTRRDPSQREMLLHAYVGPLAAALPRLMRAHGLDPAPLLAAWARSDDPRLRWLPEALQALTHHS